MVSLTFDPFREMDRLTSQLLGTSSSRGPRWMPMDLYRVDDHFVVAVDLPGVDPGSIDISVEGNALTVTAARTAPSSDGDYLVAERPRGRYSRQLMVGRDLDTEKLHASYTDGVLSLTIPVADKAKPRKVQVEHTASSGGSIEASSSDREASST